MKVFPVVERELRAASRRRGTYWVRFVAAAVAIVIAGWILLLTRDSVQSDQISKSIFIALSIFAFIYCLFAGVRNTADCISEERREGTLGLLFLTDLKPFDVLFGKLAATSLNSLYGLVAMFPVLALPLLLGGMTFDQYSVMLLVLLNTLFLSLAVGLCVSTYVQGERAAMSLTLFMVFFFCFGWSIFGWLLIDQILGWDGAFEKWWSEAVFGWVSPYYTFANLLDSLDRVNINESVWHSLGVTHLISWLLIFIAQRNLPRIWQDKAETVRGLRWKQRWKLWSHGNSAQRLDYRRKLLDESPTYWLGSRNRIKPTIVWAGLGILGLLWLWGYVENPNDWLDEGVSIVTGLILTTVLKVWVSVEASHRFNQDRHSGALELLLSTPLEVSEIIRGQMHALKRQFLWPAVAVLGIHFLFILSTKASGGLVTWWLGSMAMLVADLFAIAYIGMWLGLNHRRATRAGGATLARILMLPWLMIIGFFTFVVVVAKFSGLGRIENLFITVWLMTGFGVSLYFGLRAWNGLHDKLRDLAASRFDAGGGTKG
jgi:ABC-type transport system involved in multi-copper enzyme maturation permease subunit